MVEITNSEMETNIGSCFRSIQSYEVFRITNSALLREARGCGRTATERSEEAAARWCRVSASNSNSVL